MQILLLQDSADVREKITFLLESTFGATVVGLATITDALAYVAKPQQQIDLIIWDCKSGIPSETDSFRAVTTKIPMIISVQGAPEGVAKTSNLVGVVDRTNLADTLINTINSLVAKNILRPGVKDSDQVRIRTKLLLSVCPLKGDIYIRLSKNKYVKLFREGDTFDLQDLEKYTVKKGVEFLYIRKEQCQEFAQKYLTELQTLLLSTQNVSVEQAGKMNTSVQETVQELTSRIGFTKEVQELTKSQVQLTIKSMGKNPNLAELLKKLESGQGLYISSHSTLVAYLACAIASQMKWGSDTTFYKLSLAAFLHDITLENQTIAEIQTMNELLQRQSEFNETEIKAFKDHPAAAADMAKRMSEIPPDVDTIIRQHHERPDGSGFPRKLAHSYIAPLSCVFIIAHDLAQYTLKSGADFNLSNFVAGVREVYRQSQFKKVLGSLESLSQLKSFQESVVPNKKK